MYDLISQNIHQFRETDFQQNNPMLNLVCLRLIMKSRNGKKSHWRVIFKADQIISSINWPFDYELSPFSREDFD